MANQSSDQKPPASPAPNPALRDLSVLAGEWQMEISNGTFLPNPSDGVEGHASFAWVQDGAFLEMRQGVEPQNAPGAIWLMSRDESSAEYQVLYYDTRGVSRIYEMSIQDGAWKMWRKSPGFSQRYEARLAEDGNSIKGYWEKSADGQHWQHDFDLDYRRIP